MWPSTRRGGGGRGMLLQPQPIGGSGPLWCTAHAAGLFHSISLSVSLSLILSVYLFISLPLSLQAKNMVILSSAPHPPLLFYK